MPSAAPGSTGPSRQILHTDNFAAVRLLAAMTVVFGHSFPLTGGEGPGFFGSPSSTLAVKVFFVISGLLISESWIRDPAPTRYLARRALRIFPALAVLILVSILIVGPLFTRLSLGEYFHNPRTWVYLQNIILLPSYDLPGVFERNVYPGAVNGSLWTLPVEFSMYLLVPVVLSAPFPRYAIAFTALGFSAASLWFTRLHIPEQSLVLWGTNLVNGLEMAPYFFWGAFYQVWVPRRLMNVQAALLVMAFAPLAITGWASAEIVALLVVPYLVVSLGYATPPILGWLARYGDFSYGAYLYGFLCQQIVAHLAPSPGVPWKNFLLSAVPTLILGAASWRLIEAPALRLKPSAGRSQATMRASDSKVSPAEGNVIG